MFANNERFKSNSINEGIKSQRISLNFQKIQTRTALHLLAEFSGMNIIVSDKVTGDISLNLNDVPWERALDIILLTQSLEKSQVDNILLIAPAGANINSNKKSIHARQKPENLTPLKSDLFQINYAKASDLVILLQNKMTLLSSRGKVIADNRTNQLWVQDNAAHLKKIKALLREVDIPVKQVLIEARLVNVTKDFVRDLGIHFRVSRLTDFPDRLNNKEWLPKTIATDNKSALADRLNFDFVTGPLLASPALGVALARLGDGVLLDLELSALESEGQGEVISSPRLITTNQQPALIESGEEIPYQEATSSGATAVAFKKAVLSLKVTPQITPDGKILMDLKINQDIPSPKVFNGVPTILTKEIQTNVLVNNGQTIVLGGIYKQDKNKEMNRVPFLGGLPIVGVLFRNQSTAIRNEELLIFITPRIISDSLSLPYVDK